jgi:16S rRNA G966 N2-methylase RsmD
MTGKLSQQPTFGAGNRIDAGPADDLLAFAGSKRFTTVLADPPWQLTIVPAKSRQSIAASRAKPQSLSRISRPFRSQRY